MIESLEPRRMFNVSTTAMAMPTFANQLAHIDGMKTLTQSVVVNAKGAYAEVRLSTGKVVWSQRITQKNAVSPDQMRRLALAAQAAYTRYNAVLIDSLTTH